MLFDNDTADIYVFLRNQLHMDTDVFNELLSVAAKYTGG